MSKIKPIGSEKLQGIEKLQRIMEIARYKEAIPNSINETSSIDYRITLADGNTYEIVKERLGYIIKKQINESEDNLINIYKQQSEEVRLLSYKLLIESLNEKYKGLDTNQKNLLKEYINNISNTNSLNKLIVSEIENVKSQLTECLSKIDNDIIKIKINEVVKQLNNVKPSSNVKDNQIMVLLLSYELLKEIKNKL
jgi:hypothetical protein